MSNPIVYQTFFSTLKYKNIKIIIEELIGKKKHLKNTEIWVQFSKHMILLMIIL